MRGNDKRIKLVLLCLSVVMTLVLLTACANRNDVPQSPAPNVEMQRKVTPPPTPAAPTPAPTQPAPAAPTPTATTTPTKTTPAPTKTTPTPAVTPSKKPLEAQTTIGDYFPLKKGNSWSYEGIGSEFATFTQKVTYSKGSKFQVATDNGGTIMVNVFDIRKDRIVNSFRKAEAYGNENYLAKKSNLDITVLKSPIAKGTSWISEENSYEIVDTNATVTVPAGTFSKCVVVRMVFKDETAEARVYLKKGVGMVQSDFIPTAGERISSKLKSYNIVK